MFSSEVEPHVPIETLLFEQDSFSKIFLLMSENKYHAEIFPRRWIERRRTIEWSLRSPDLTPLDYFLWEYLKDKFNQNRSGSIEDRQLKKETCLSCTYSSH